MPNMQGEIDVSLPMELQETKDRILDDVSNTKPVPRVLIAAQ